VGDASLGISVVGDLGLFGGPVGAIGKAGFEAVSSGGRHQQVLETDRGRDQR
jgi:hypothetical protein